MRFRAVEFRGMFGDEVTSFSFSDSSLFSEGSIDVGGGSFLAESSFFGFALEFSL